MKRAIILVGPEFQDEEYIYPYYRFQEDNFTLDVASVDAKPMFGKYGVPAKITKSTRDLNADDYDVVFVPGGTESPDRMRQDKYILNFIYQMNIQNKIIGSICHGPWVLISANIVKDRKITCYVGMKDDVINAGAKYVDSPVVIDGNIITSPHYRNNGDLMREILIKTKNNNE